MVSNWAKIGPKGPNVKYDVAFYGKSIRGRWRRLWSLYKNFRYPNIGVNKKWVSNWENIGPKWPNVKYDVAFCGLLWQKYARKAAEIWSLYKKCDGGGHFLLCCKTSFFFVTWFSSWCWSWYQYFGYARLCYEQEWWWWWLHRYAPRRARRPPLLSTLLPMAAKTHRIKIFYICSKITAKKKLERLQFSTSSWFYKI